MRKTLGFLAITGLFMAIGCGGRDQAGSSQQQQYETVQEGAASGVTSTIHGPGETIPPMTGTNADTTSAFTLNPNLAAAPATPPGTLAGSLPTQPYGGAGGSGYTPSPTPRAVPPPRGDTTWRTEPTTTTTTEPVTSTTEAQPPPPTQTDAAPPPTQTQTDPPPPAEKPKEEPAPPATETQKTDTQQSTPPPPPPA